MKNYFCIIKPKYFLVILVLTLTNGSILAGNINCGNSTCNTTDLNLKFPTNEAGNFSKVWVSGITDTPGNYLRGQVPNGTTPHNLKLYLGLNKNDPNSIFSTIATPKAEVELNFSSMISGYNSGEAVIVAAMLSGLSLVSDGKDGVDGLSSTKLCAQAFKSGYLGPVLQNYWNSSHNASVTGCNQADVTRAYNSFFCPSGYQYTINSFVPITRYVRVRKCYNGQGSYTYVNKNSQCLVGLVDLGLVKDPSGNTETFNCSFDGVCDLIFEKKEYPLSLVTLSPTAGTTAILAGKMSAFVYSYDNLIYSNYNGIYGIGGQADLTQYMPNPAATPKYCYFKYDLNGAPSSDYFLNPYLSFHKINWQPFIEKPTANDGLSGVLKNGTTTVIKGLDSSVRYWLGNDMIQN